jgi:CTP:molybdopterin cytidylyltransferase MocA
LSGLGEMKRSELIGIVLGAGFSRRLLYGDKAVWKLADPPSDRGRRVATDRALPPDVNTREDYEAARRSLGIGAEQRVG